MEQKIRELRLEVDKFINSVSALNPSREVSLCYTNLQRSKAWLGMVLGELGSKNPYPKSSDPTSSVIEPQAEHQYDTIWSPASEPIEQTQTAFVKYFRQEIGIYQTRIDQIVDEMDITKDIGKWGWQYIIESRKAMIEAKHWLGWELDRIRKEKDQKPNQPRTELAL